MRPPNRVTKRPTIENVIILELPVGARVGVAVITRFCAGAWVGVAVNKTCVGSALMLRAGVGVGVAVILG